jgi:DNA mismatch repair ATPase MutL
MSGSFVQSFSQAVEACCLNSILAKARHIVVSISPRSFGFTVEDDGHGIPANLLLRFAKHTPAGATPGGCLAALANASRLNITSKATAAFETCQVTLANGRVINTGLAAHQRSTQGTVVRIEDLFYSQPVRRKQMTHAR